ncbi:MAG: hypothetical protein U9N61_06835 [Euryarchaeota archaeon]|nr:hypothetical protein [Euryarchaeota archaeon]
MITTTSNSITLKKILPRGLVTSYAGLENNFHLNAKINSFNQITDELLAHGGGITITSLVDSTFEVDGLIEMTVHTVRIGITRYDLMFSEDSVDLDNGQAGVEKIGFGSVKRIENETVLEI